MTEDSFHDLDACKFCSVFFLGESAIPNKITIRYITGPICPLLIIEHDDVGVKTEELDAEDPTTVLKGIEHTLSTLGYQPDLQKMYMDDALLVLDFYKEAKEES